MSSVRQPRAIGVLPTAIARACQERAAWSYAIFAKDTLFVWTLCPEILLWTTAIAEGAKNNWLSLEFASVSTAASIWNFGKNVHLHVSDLLNVIYIIIKQFYMKALEVVNNPHISNQWHSETPSCSNTIHHTNKDYKPTIIQWQKIETHKRTYVFHHQANCFSSLT